MCRALEVLIMDRFSLPEAVAHAHCVLSPCDVFLPTAVLVLTLSLVMMHDPDTCIFIVLCVRGHLNSTTCSCCAS